jgi:hypothetical protein
MWGGFILSEQDKEMLRDVFAGLALVGIIVKYGGEDTESASLTAYEYADQMMLAREGKEEPESGIVAVKPKRKRPL